MEKREPLKFKPIENPLLVKMANTQYLLQGEVQFHKQVPYAYLKLDDDFIYKLFPLIQEEGLSLPAYFHPDNYTGAHISIVYPNEKNASKMIQDLKSHKAIKTATFEITSFAAMHISQKTRFALIVTSRELEELRALYGLSKKLNYRGFQVPFHITLGVRVLK